MIFFGQRAFNHENRAHLSQRGCPYHLMHRFGLNYTIFPVLRWCYDTFVSFSTRCRLDILVFCSIRIFKINPPTDAHFLLYRSIAACNSYCTGR